MQFEAQQNSDYGAQGSYLRQCQVHEDHTSGQYMYAQVGVYPYKNHGRGESRQHNLDHMFLPYGADIRPG